MRPDQQAATFSDTGAGTNAGVTVTETGAANKRKFCTGIQMSGDAAALVTVESPAGTVLWQKRYAAAFDDSADFHVAPLKGAVGSDMLVKISASTSHCEANIQGYTG